MYLTRQSLTYILFKGVFVGWFVEWSTHMQWVPHTKTLGTIRLLMKTMLSIYLTFIVIVHFVLLNLKVRWNETHSISEDFCIVHSCWSVSSFFLYHSKYVCQSEDFIFFGTNVIFDSIFVCNAIRVYNILHARIFIPSQNHPSINMVLTQTITRVYEDSPPWCIRQTHIKSGSYYNFDTHK